MYLKAFANSLAFSAVPTEYEMTANDQVLTVKAEEASEVPDNSSKRLETVKARAK